jgi:phosphoribosylanthranilate isomerase
VFVKICGLTSIDAVAAAVAAGADAVGFVFAASPREVTPEQALTMCESLPENVIRVAVMRHPSAEHCDRVCTLFAPNWVQSDAEDFVYLKLPPGCEPLPVYRSARPLPSTKPVRLLFEGPVSGKGRPADWEEAARLARQTNLILAGGLTPANVSAAVDRVRPWGVDVSSGVELEAGRKSPEAIAKFVARARATEPS